MTTTAKCETFNCDQSATEAVTAQHFDPDPDDEGRAIGWSRPITTDLCDEHLEEWQNDELVAICERVVL